MPETWPSQFPKPNSGFSHAEDSPVNVVQFDSNEFRQRPVRRGKRREVLASWTFEGSALGMFIAWVHYKLDKGKDFFDCPLPLEGGSFSTFSVRLVEPKISVSLANLPSSWEVKTRLETFD